ncbi:MAG: MarR family transcriptional regulator [Tepidisphaeraceae bacterium]|jgi:DNA-binding MarR family transcriptional regulator
MSGRLGKEIGKTGPFESLEQEVFLNCIRTADWLSHGAANVLKSARLSPTQYNVLRILRGVGPMGLGCQEIGRRMITREPDLTRLLDRLEKRGLVVRRRETADRRVVRTTITDAGLAILAAMDEPVRNHHLHLLAHMAPERLATLNELLEEARNAPAMTKDLE